MAEGSRSFEILVIAPSCGAARLPVGVPRICLRSGRGRGLGRHRVDADLEARLALVLELHHAVDERVDRVVGPETDVLPRVPARAALRHDDVAGHDPLTAELLDAAVFRVAVAAVARR